MRCGTDGVLPRDTGTTPHCDGSTVHVLRHTVCLVLMFQLCNSVFYTVSPNKHFPISLFITSGIVSFKVVACARPVRIDYDNADLGHADLSLVLLT